MEITRVLINFFCNKWIYTLSIFIWAGLVGQFLMQFPFPDPSLGIDWPKSLGVGAVLIPPLVITAVRRQGAYFLATVFVAAVWGWGYYLHIENGDRLAYDLLDGMFAYAVLASTLFIIRTFQVLNQTASRPTESPLIQMCIISWVKVLFGGAIYFAIGRYISTADHGLLRLVDAIFFVLITIPAGLKRREFPPKEEDRRGYRAPDINEFEAAA